MKLRCVYVGVYVYWCVCVHRNCFCELRYTYLSLYVRSLMQKKPPFSFVFLVILPSILFFY